MRPNFGHVENIPAVVLRLLWCHDLKVHGPGRVFASRNGIIQVGGVVAWVFSGDAICFFLREILDALI